MTRKKRSIRYAKAHAYGNDFLLVCESKDVVSPENLARSICDRNLGIGADGLILYRNDDSQFFMSLFNQDGSFAEVSGNGLRCLGAYLSYSKLTELTRIDVVTDAGRMQLDLLERNDARFTVRTDLGAPKKIRTDLFLEVEGRRFKTTTLSMGNPHCVVFEDLEELSVVGPVMSNHPHFLHKTNVELVQVMNEYAIRVAIWERGVGPTASSGTGSAAAAVAALMTGEVKSPVQVHCPGGMLEVYWEEGQHVMVTGDAVVVSEGVYLG